MLIFIHKGIQRNDFEVVLWRHRWRHHHENIFSCIIWDELFISGVKLKLCLIFWHFQNGRHFELATKVFIGSDTGSWICYKDNHEHLWHFELLINVLAQILTELLQFKVLTYLGWWEDISGLLFSLYRSLSRSFKAMLAVVVERNRSTKRIHTKKV